MDLVDNLDTADRSEENEEDVPGVPQVLHCLFPRQYPLLQASLQTTVTVACMIPAP